MKKKELKQFAEKIAKYELIIEQSEDHDEIRYAQEQIMILSGRVKDLEDLFEIDELVQEILEKKKNS